MTIHTLWVQGTPPRLVRECLKSMPATGLPVTAYSYAPDTMPTIDGVTIADARTILPETEIFTYQIGSGKGSYAAFANLFRYETLYKHGGWWLDADVYCLKPLTGNSMLDHAYVFVREPNHSLVHNGIIKCPEKAPIMRDLIAGARAVPHSNMRWGQTGARLLSALLRTKHNNLQCRVINSMYFTPLPWQVITQYISDPPKVLPKLAVAVHLFHERWRQAHLDADIRYPIYDWLATRRVQ
jgi:hypothetical protein